MNLNNRDVALHFTESKGYPEQIGYDPPVGYSEYTDRALNIDNEVYCGVRDLLSSWAWIGKIVIKGNEMRLET